MTQDPVDVLIIGAGASGAAVAWSLADTRMRILCLEQGGMPDQQTFPTTGRNWEAWRTGDFALSPNQRGLPEDYPINDDASPIKVTNFNGVGGGTVLYAAHFPRLHPSDFKVRTLDGVEDDWPVDYQTLAPFFAKNDRMMEHCCTYQIEALSKNWLPNESGGEQNSSFSMCPQTLRQNHLFAIGIQTYLCSPPRIKTIEVTG
jgi:choline dehydrogenase-like flavoprotein